MAIIYYPSNATVYVRTAPGAVMTGLFIDTTPDQIIVLSGSMNTASVDFLTASYALNYLISSSKSSTADTASVAVFAQNGGDPLANIVFS